MENNNHKHPLLSSTTTNDVMMRKSKLQKQPPTLDQRLCMKMRRKPCFLRHHLRSCVLVNTHLALSPSTISGQLSTLDLAAFSVENSVIAGFSFGLL
ncbi:Protein DETOXIFICATION 30, partial [Bienertia sinuspersici]